MTNFILTITFNGYFPFFFGYTVRILNIQFQIKFIFEVEAFTPCRCVSYARSQESASIHINELAAAEKKIFTLHDENKFNLNSLSSNFITQFKRIKFTIKSKSKIFFLNFDSLKKITLVPHLSYLTTSTKVMIFDQFRLIMTKSNTTRNQPLVFLFFLNFEVSKTCTNSFFWSRIKKDY